MIGVASQPYVASTRARSSACADAAAKRLAALVEHAAPVGRDELSARFDEARQRRLRIGRYRERHFLKALDVLVVAAHVQVVARNAEHLRVGLSEWDRAAHLLVAVAIEAAVERVLVQRENHVCVRHVAAAAQRMLVRHAAAATLHRRLQRLGELDEQTHAVLVARHVAREHERVLGADEQLRDFCDRRRVAGRRARERELRNPQRRAVTHRFFLQRRVDDQHHGAARLRHRHAVGAHGGLREVLQRRRRVVPLQHVAHHRGRVRHRVRPPVEQRPPVLAAGDVRAQEIRRASVPRTRRRYPSPRVASPTERT